MIPPLIVISRKRAASGIGDHVRNGANAGMEHPIRARFVGIVMILAAIVGWSLGFIGRILLSLDPMFLMPGLLKWAGFDVGLFPIEEIAVVYYPSGWGVNACPPAVLDLESESKPPGPPATV